MLAFVLVAVIQVTEAREEQLPIDPELRIGRLENGLTYYIRHNEQPQGRAEFWLVQNTGSLVEDEDERGLAHMIEHIAFQGTRNFPGIDMVDILQNNGVSYGRDINASRCCHNGVSASLKAVKWSIFIFIGIHVFWVSHLMADEIILIGIPCMPTKPCACMRTLFPSCSLAAVMPTAFLSET